MFERIVSRSVAPLDLPRALSCLLVLVAAGPAFAEGAASAQLCRRAATDDAPRTPPESLMPAIRRAFDLDDKYPSEAAYYRCVGGHALACVVGANLPCGKAKLARSLPAATEWCQDNPNADFIPAAVTGHDTIYSWSCAERVAKPGKKIGQLDGRGFFRDNWKRLP